MSVFPYMDVKNQQQTSICSCHDAAAIDLLGAYPLPQTYCELPT